ncbi:MAG: glutaredoxin family protein, partial [Spirochaetota bacterium]
MYSSIPYTYPEGAPDDRPVDVYFYGLSFCDHCAEGRSLLEKLGVPFAMTYLDQLDPGVRRPVLQAFRKLHGERVLFPVLEVDGEFTFGY